MPEDPVRTIDSRDSVWSEEFPMSPPSRYFWVNAQESTGLYAVPDSTDVSIFTSRLREKNAGLSGRQSSFFSSFVQMASKGTSGQFWAVSLVRLPQSVAVQRSA